MATTAEEAGWTSKLGNMFSTGASPHIAPRRISECPRWGVGPGGIVKGRSGKVFVATNIETSPLIDASGDLYITGNDGVWKFHRDGNLDFGPCPEGVEDVIGTPALLERTLFIATLSGKAFAIDSLSGEIKWAAQYCRGVAAEPLAIAASAGTVVLTGFQKEPTGPLPMNYSVFGLNANNGSAKWTLDFSYPLLLFSPAAIDDTFIFKELMGEVSCLQLSDGVQRWKSRPSKLGRSAGGVGVSKKLGLVVATSNIAGRADWNKPFGGKGLVCAYSLKDGNIRWERQFDLEANTLPAILSKGDSSQSVVVVALAANPAGQVIEWEKLLSGEWRGKVVGLEPADGAILWSLEPPAWVRHPGDWSGLSSGEQLVCSWSNPVGGADGVVYVGWIGGYLFAVDSASGEKLDQFRWRRPLCFTPAVGKDMLVLNRPGGELFLWQAQPWNWGPPSDNTRWLVLDDGELLQDLDCPFSVSGTNHFWPTKHGDLRWVGKSIGSYNREEVQPVWSFESGRRHGGDCMEGTVVVDAQGHMYFGNRFSTGLCIFRPDGSLRGRVFTGPNLETPALCGTTAYGSNSMGYAWAVDIETLKTKWRKRYCLYTACNTAGPQIVPGTGEPQDTLIIPGTAEPPIVYHNRCVYGIDASNGDTRWKFDAHGLLPERVPDDFPHFHNNTPIRLDDHLLVSDNSGGMYRISWKDGSVIWARPDIAEIGEHPHTSGQAVVGPGPKEVAYIGFNLGSNKTERFRPKWNAAYGGHGKMTAVYADDGSLKWEREFNLEAHTAPLIMHDGGKSDKLLVLLPLGSFGSASYPHGGDTWEGRLEALDPDTGETVWSWAPPVHKSNFAVGQSLEYASGPNCWSGACLSDNGSIHIAWHDGFIYGLEGATGRLLRKFYMADYSPGHITLAPGLMAYCMSNIALCWRDPVAEKEWREEAKKAGDPRAAIEWPATTSEQAEQALVAVENSHKLTGGAHFTEGAKEAWYMDMFIQGYYPDGELYSLSLLAPIMAKTICNPVPMDSVPRREWIVIGGSESGGIVVRSGKELTSAVVEPRLMHSAIIEEVKKVGERVQYKTIWGEGPDQGWVSCKLKGNQLLSPTGRIREGA